MARQITMICDPAKAEISSVTNVVTVKGAFGPTDSASVFFGSYTAGAGFEIDKEILVDDPPSEIKVDSIQVKVTITEKATPSPTAGTPDRYVLVLHTDDFVSAKAVFEVTAKAVVGPALKKLQDSQSAQENKPGR